MGAHNSFQLFIVRQVETNQLNEPSIIFIIAENLQEFALDTSYVRALPMGEMGSAGTAALAEPRPNQSRNVIGKTHAST